MRLQSTTLRKFDGGLNVADDDLNMSPEFAPVLDNIDRSPRGAQQVRYGTKLFSTMTDTSEIINCTYFNERVIVVQASGRVYQVNGAGTATEMLLNTTGAKPWPAGVTVVSFAVSNNALIIVNGRDKPLSISGNTSDPLYMLLTLLVDEGTLSNVNTPIGKFVCVIAQYTIVAGIPNKPSTLSISARNTRGTFLNDPAPNDAIELDLGPRVTLGSSTITGLMTYNNKLIVAFEEGVLPINLGVYESAVHKPTDDGFIEGYGCISHRSMVSIGDDGYFVGNSGVEAMRRATFSDRVRPDHISSQIDPLLTEMLSALSPAQIARYVHSVFDLARRRYIIFIPSFDENGLIEETVGFAYTALPKLRVLRWSRIRGWRWSASCRTALQNIIFAQANKLYTLDTTATDRAVDYFGDTAYNGGLGVPITFDWELPWADFDNRMWRKKLAELRVDATGTGTFSFSIYTDQVRYDELGNDVPLMTMEWVGGDPEGAGMPDGTDFGFGTGRIASDARIMDFPAEFGLLKMRVHGETDKPLRFMGISVLYSRHLGGV
jgi:hypothetical protein